MRLASRQQARRSSGAQRRRRPGVGAEEGCCVVAIVSRGLQGAWVEAKPLYWRMLKMFQRARSSPQTRSTHDADDTNSALLTSPLRDSLNSETIWSNPLKQPKSDPKSSRVEVPTAITYSSRIEGSSIDRHSSSVRRQLQTQKTRAAAQHARTALALHSPPQHPKCRSPRRRCGRRRRPPPTRRALQPSLRRRSARRSTPRSTTRHTLCCTTARCTASRRTASSSRRLRPASPRQRRCATMMAAMMAAAVALALTLVAEA